MRVVTKLASSLFLATLLFFMPVSAKSEVVSGFENDPIFKDFKKLQEDMNKIFERFNSSAFDKDLRDQFFKDYKFSSPKADIKDKKDHYEVKVDLPGSNNANINVKVKENILNIDATAKKVEEKKGDKFIKQERFVGAVHRSLTLPDDADTDKLKTDYKDGVLTVIIPKKK
jgi:HSP20 family protein